MTDVKIKGAYSKDEKTIGVEITNLATGEKKFYPGLKVKTVYEINEFDPKEAA